jgi:hypothetical protein
VKVNRKLSGESRGTVHVAPRAGTAGGQPDPRTGVGAGEAHMGDGFDAVPRPPDRITSRSRTRWSRSTLFLNPPLWKQDRRHDTAGMASKRSDG